MNPIFFVPLMLLATSVCNYLSIYGTDFNGNEILHTFFRRCTTVVRNLEGGNLYFQRMYEDLKIDIPNKVRELERVCPGVSNKAKDSFLPFEECIIKVDNKLSLCAKAEIYILNCTEHFVNLAEDCASEMYKGLPRLIIKALYSAVDHLCKQSGQTLCEFDNPYFWNGLDRNWYNNRNDTITKKFEQCRRRVGEAFKRSGNLARDICAEVPFFRSCVETYVTTTCKNPITRNAWLNLYDATTASCAKDNEVHKIS